MKIAVPLLFAILSSSLLADESVEPKLNYTLRIGERSYAISEGKTFEVDQISEKSKARLVADVHRIFSHQNFSFKYPRYFAFEADLSDPGHKSWALSGNDTKIMILTFRDTLTPKQFAANLAQTFGEKNTTIADAKVNLGKAVYDGALVDTTVAGSRMMMEILPTTTPKGWTKLIVIQDSVSDAGAHSQEYKELMVMLSESFAETKSGEQDGAGQPATRSESK